MWLDPPRIVAAWRVLRRWIGFQLRGHAPYGWRKALRIVVGALRPRPLAEVFASPKNLNPSRAAIAAVLVPYEAKTVRAWRRSDLRALVQSLMSEVKRVQWESGS